MPIIFNPYPVGQRTLPAWNAMWEILDDGRWHIYSEVVDIMESHSDLARKTCVNRVHNALASGGVQSLGTGSTKIIRKVQ